MLDLRNSKRKRQWWTLASGRRADGSSDGARARGAHVAAERSFDGDTRGPEGRGLRRAARRDISGPTRQLYCHEPWHTRRLHHLL